MVLARIAAAKRYIGRVSVLESKTVQAQRKTSRCRSGAQTRILAVGLHPNSLQSAEELEAQAAALTLPVASPMIRSGEVFATIDDAGPVYEIQNTLRDPKQTAIDASVERTGVSAPRKTPTSSL